MRNLKTKVDIIEENVDEEDDERVDSSSEKSISASKSHLPE